jgi:hypothetical protein
MTSFIVAVEGISKDNNFSWKKVARILRIRIGFCLILKKSKNKYFKPIFVAEIT